MRTKRVRIAGSKRLDPLQRRAVEQRLDPVPRDVGGHLLIGRNRPASVGGLEDRPEEAGIAGGVEEQTRPAKHVTYRPGQRVTIGQRLVPAELLRLLLPASADARPT